MWQTYNWQFVLIFNSHNCRVSLIPQLVKNLPVMPVMPRLDYWVEKICWRRDRLPTPVFLGFPCLTAGKESACKEDDLGSIPGLGIIPWRRARLPTPVFWPREFHELHGVAKSRTRLSDFHFHSALRVGVLTCFSCVWICDPMNCSPPGFSIHGPLKARLLEWVSMLFSRGSSWPRDWTLVSFITGRFSIDRVTGEAPLQYFISPDMWCWQILCKGPECK